MHPKLTEKDFGSCIFTHGQKRSAATFRKIQLFPEMPGGYPAEWMEAALITEVIVGGRLQRKCRDSDQQ